MRDDLLSRVWLPWSLTYLRRKIAGLSPEHPTISQSGVLTWWGHPDSQIFLGYFSPVIDIPGKARSEITLFPVMVFPKAVWVGRSNQSISRMHDFWILSKNVQNSLLLCNNIQHCTSLCHIGTLFSRFIGTKQFDFFPSLVPCLILCFVWSSSLTAVLSFLIIRLALIRWDEKYRRATHQLTASFLVEKSHDRFLDPNQFLIRWR